MKNIAGYWNCGIPAIVNDFINAKDVKVILANHKFHEILKPAGNLLLTTKPYNNE